MKIVFSDLPMKKELHGFKYKVDGNATIEYDGETIFPVNSVLAKTMKKGEKVKVVLLSKVDIEGNSAINAGKFQKELNDINRTIGADIEYNKVWWPYKAAYSEDGVNDLCGRYFCAKKLCARACFGKTMLGHCEVNIIVLVAVAGGKMTSCHTQREITVFAGNFNQLNRHNVLLPTDASFL